MPKQSPTARGSLMKKIWAKIIEFKDCKNYKPPYRNEVSATLRIMMSRMKKKITKTFHF